MQIFKPKIDNRYGDDHIISHSEMRIPSENLSSSRELLTRVEPDTEVVGIDEGQFFDAELPAVCSTLADQGKRVIVAGLDQDYLGKPFEPMPQLLAIAEYITKTLAICMVCGAPANHTQRLVASSERVLVGAQGTYEARCRHCFDPTPRAVRTVPIDAGCRLPRDRDASSSPQPDPATLVSVVGFLRSQPPAVLSVHPLPPAPIVGAADLAGPRGRRSTASCSCSARCWRCSSSTSSRSCG